ncbi:MAG: T9SS type A sorting domain-containing protein [Candidatus Kapaibacterium sp.]|nr:T9SS type A sorting domain-containing protein [Ignavibacteriota bacterium]MCB9220381.1 T9SS type A sorting domain-containing protein [Ignavibacteria bacterium]
MKNLVMLTLLIFSLQSALLADWESIDNINKSLPNINNLELYDNNLIASSQNSIYKYNRILNEWDLLSNDNITELDSYSYIYAKGDTIIAHSSTKGTFLSTNSGVTWSETILFSGINGLSDYQSNDYYSFALGVTGISRSKKGEFKWEKLTIPDEDAFISISVKDSIVALSNLAYTLMNGEIIKGGIFISKDNGNTFVKYFGLASIKQIEIVDGNTIIAMSESKLYKSSNYGETWDVKDIGSLSNFFEHLNKELFVFTEDNEIIKYDSDLNKLGRFSQENGNNVKQLSCSQGLNNKLYIGTWRGVYEFDTESMTMKLNSPVGSNTNLFYVNNIENNIYYSGYEIGLNYTTDKGKSWQSFSNSLDSINKSASRFAKKGKYAIGSNYLSYPLYTTKNLTDWEVIERNLFGAISNIGIIDSVFYMSTEKGLYFNSLKSSTWEKVENLKDEKNYNIPIQSILDVGHALFVGTAGEGIHRTEDIGETWLKEKSNNEIFENSTVTILSNYKDKIRAILKVFSNEQHIFEYSKENNSWSAIGLLGKIQIKKMKFVGDNIFFTTNQGMSYTNDFGKTITLINEGLKESDLLYMNNFTFFDNYIYMVNSNGMYRRSLSDFGITSVESEIERNYLYTYPPYPNPAKSEVKVLFYWDINLPMSTDDINIYDLSGKKVITDSNLRIEKQANHYGNLIWDCSSVQPGIYLINIKHGTEEKAVKVVVE